MKINVFLHDSFKTHRPVIISSEFQSTKGEMLIEYWMEIKLFLFTSFNLEYGKMVRSKTYVLCVWHFGGKKKPTAYAATNFKTKLPFFPDPPLLLKNLWRDDTPEARIFREYAR